jgi:DMSO/TMAO reductase YedYZ molybdopterin-dependent catalytic subunit
VTSSDRERQDGAGLPGPAASDVPYAPPMSLRSRVLRAATVLAAVELAALLLVRLPSPTGTLAGLLVTSTPGPIATWFLQLFRGAARPLTIVASAAVLIAVVTLASLLARGRPRDGRGPEPAAAPLRPTPVPQVIGRRALLAGLGLGGLLIVGGGLLLRPRSSAAHVALAGRMRARRGLPPLTAAQDLSGTLPGLTPILTPVEEFFRIDTAITLPRVDAATWTLRVHGRVEREVVLDLDDLIDLGLEEHDATISCVSNEVAGGLVGTARWTGVPLSRVLALAGPLPDADQLVGRSVDGWTGGFPTVLAAAPDALVAIGMNGVELPVRHGYPARLVVPGLYGYVSATKWLSDIELTRWDDYDAYWIRRGWAKSGPVKTMTRIDVPGRVVTPGTVRVAGVAWAPPRGIRTVELRVDRGPWLEAECSDPLGDAVWRQWVIDVELEPGDHVLQARAIDGAGAVQPEGPRDVLPDGAEGWHWIPVLART